jgi:DnaJ-class molecular chaperone
MSDEGGDSKTNDSGRDEPPPPCARCQGTGLTADRKRFCSACLGSGKDSKRPYGWQ